MSAERHVDFSITSETVTAAEMTQGIGMGPDRTYVRGEAPEIPRHPRPALYHEWRITSGGSGAAHMFDLVEATMSKVVPVLPAIQELVQQGCRCHLTVVAHFHEGDTGSAAFSFDRTTIAILNELQATIEADLYV